MFVDIEEDADSRQKDDERGGAVGDEGEWEAGRWNKAKHYGKIEQGLDCNN